MSLRKYPLTDAELLEEAEIMYEEFEKDQPDFQAFDTTMDDKYLEGFRNSIADGKAAAGQSELLGGQLVLSGKVNTLVKETGTIWKKAKYFIQKAFNGDKAKLVEFGGREYRKARKNPANLVTFMDTLNKACVTNAAQLKLNGCSQKLLDEIASHQAILTGKNTEYGLYQNQRPTLTSDRIDKLNNLYSLMKQINKASKNVYPTDLIKQNIYDFEPDAATPDYGGSIKAGQLIDLDEVDYDAQSELKVKNKGETELIIGLGSNSSTMLGNGISVMPSTSITISMGQLAAAGTHLLLKNNSSTQTGKYEINLD